MNDKNMHYLERGKGPDLRLDGEPMGNPFGQFLEILIGKWATCV